MSIADFERFARERFPQILEHDMRIESIEDGRLRLPYADKHLRPGGTISGPSIMALADSAFYFLLLSMIGPVELAVTTNLSIDFMRKPAAKDLLADAEMLKLGRRLAVGRVTMTSEGDSRPVAHATLTYAIPPER